MTLLPAVPDAPGGGHLALRPLHDASEHRHRGPAVAPVLSDDWSGRVVSTHAPDILRDLPRRFGGDGPVLHPCGTEDAARAAARLGERGMWRSPPCWAHWASWSGGSDRTPTCSAAG
ncbi:hypothetical protein GCM10010344_07140 [Streptomyces bluensis]|nr:hypothetical protein GCM10010344_07140 [Streptomyces bluensis]